MFAGVTLSLQHTCFYTSKFKMGCLCSHPPESACFQCALSYVEADPILWRLVAHSAHGILPDLECVADHIPIIFIRITGYV